MQKDLIKQIVANILYLDDSSTVENDRSLFTVYDLSSIDFIDLCFEISQKTTKIFTPDDLWPINKMLTDPEMYFQENWTDKGWAMVCEILDLDCNTVKSDIRELYQHFTINYIDRRLENFT